MIVKVAPGLNPTVQIPSNSVGKAWLNADYTNRTDPNFALFGSATIGLLNLILDPAL